MARAKDIGRILERQLKKELGKQTDLSKIPTARLQLLGDTMKDGIKNRVKKGLSPIQGKGRFPRYKRGTAKDGYPNTVKKKFPGKRRRPVNLYLSGAFLRNLKTRITKFPKPKIRIGFFDRKSKLKEKGHREGANGQPRRPIIPLRNERFDRKLQSDILKEYARLLQKFIDKR